MNKLIQNQTVWYIVEDFKPFHYRIAKCKVKSVPNGRLKEYCLHEKREHHPKKVYWMQRSSIYETYDEAVKAAERISDKYDHTWSGIMGTKVQRPWREEGERE